MQKDLGGFTMIELLFAVTVMVMALAVAIPGTMSAMRRYDVNSASREVATAIRGARLKAATANRTMRVRFNCPAAGQFRVIEVVNNAAIDDAADRCSATTYPYPDQDAAAAPNHDGPVMVLRGRAVSFGALQNLQVAPTGRVTPITGALPASVTIAGPYDNRTLTITASGRVTVP